MNHVDRYLQRNGLPEGAKTVRGYDLVLQNGAYKVYPIGEPWNLKLLLPESVKYAMFEALVDLVTA